MKQITSKKTKPAVASTDGWFVSEPFVEEVQETSLGHMLQKESERRTKDRAKEEKRKKKEARKSTLSVNTEDSSDHGSDSEPSLRPFPVLSHCAVTNLQEVESTITMVEHDPQVFYRRSGRDGALHGKAMKAKRLGPNIGGLFGKRMRSFASYFTWKGNTKTDEGASLTTVPTLAEFDFQSEPSFDKETGAAALQEAPLEEALEVTDTKKKKTKKPRHQHTKSKSDTQLTNYTTASDTASIPSRNSSVVRRQHREALMGWEADRRSPGVKGRLVEVVHGYAHNDPAQPRTLVVFEWRLIPGRYGDRIKRVRILVAFEKDDGDSADKAKKKNGYGWWKGMTSQAGSSNEEDDAGSDDGQDDDDDANSRGGSMASGEKGEQAHEEPETDIVDDFEAVPIKWSPDMPIMSNFSTTTATATDSQEYGTQVGYPHIMTGSAKYGSGLTQVVERIDARCIRGVPLVYGKAAKKSSWSQLGLDAPLDNAVQWQLEENAALKIGVQYNVRTAVLLRRKPHDMRPFRLTVCAEANLTRTRDLVKTALTAIKVIRSDSGEDRAATAFDPSVTPGSGAGGAEDSNVAARPTRRDWRNLQDENLDAVLVKDEELTTVMALAKGGSPEIGHEKPPDQEATQEQPTASTDKTTQYGFFATPQIPITVDSDSGGGDDSTGGGSNQVE